MKNKIFLTVVSALLFGGITVLIQQSELFKADITGSNTGGGSSSASCTPQESIIDDISDPGTITRQRVLEQRESLDKTIAEHETTLKNANEQYNQTNQKLQQARNENRTADISRLEGELQNLGKSRTTAQENLKSSQDKAKEMDESSTLKQAKIEKNHDQLIQSAELQKTTLENEKCDNCSPEQKEILSLKKTANEQYIAYLQAKKSYEICKANTGDPKCESNKQELDRWSQCVSSTLRAISQKETKVEQGRTFDVTNIFTTNPPGSENEEPTEFSTVVNTIANWMITLVSSLAVTTLIIGGFLMIISGGDEGRLETGKTIFTYSLIGIIVTLLSFGIISFIQSIFY